MPSIYLKQTTGTYNTGSVTVNVTPKAYPHSNLFTRYKHTFTPPSGTGNLYIYDGKRSWSSHFTLKRDNGYTEAKLKEAHVYFNKFDTDHKNPLLFVLMFQNGVPTADNKYYKWSEFKDKFKPEGQSVEISNLSRYENEQDILNDLIKENDKLDEPLTYNIGRKEGERSNGNGHTNQYNGNKICVQEDTGSDPALTSTEFRRYKHTPVNGHGSKTPV